jgi:CelD/BcsL family acetyltransferase involved in cellulose biosynthesis
MEMREINNLDDFELIKDKWNSLLETIQNKNIFLTWDWNFIWFKHYSENRNLSILIFENDKGIQGIIPMVRKKLRFHRINYTILENMGIPNSDYGGIIVPDNCKEIRDQIFNLFANFIKENKLAFRMDEVPENIKIYKELKSSLAADDIHVFVKRQPLSYCPYISLDGSWETYRSNLDKKFRKDIERNSRRFERDFGPIHFRKSSSIEELENDFDIFINLQIIKRSHKGFEQIKSDEKSFLYDIAKSFLANDWLNLSFLETKDDTIACGLAFEYNNIYYYYLNAFDPKYSSYSLGKIHYFYILKDLFNRGFKELDFMRGDETYKSVWSSSRRINERIIAYPNDSCLSKLINLLVRSRYILWHDLEMI